MIEKTGWLIYSGLGLLVTSGQAWLLLHSLIYSKPFKVVDPSDVFYYMAYVGVPASLILCGLLAYFMRSRLTGYLLPMIPVIAFPIFAWGIYQLIFAWTGLDFLSGSGDFSVRQNELEFAYDIVKVLFLGCIGGLMCVGISAILVKRLKQLSTDQN